MISFKNVTKKYPNGFKALDGIDLVIPENEFAYLIGPSGAGKSTMLRLIFMEEQVTSGEIIIDKYILGQLVEDQIPYYRRNIGMIFQDYKLLPRRTVYENVAFALHVMHFPPKKIKQQVSYALDLVGLSGKSHHYPRELSGGEQQKICIARAIVNQPSILLCDEPTGNLDPETSWEIVHLLTKINAHNTTVIMATHDTEIVDGIPKRVIAVEKGKLARDQVLGTYIQ
ncbi:MAG: cell division ATP-binding protein FtsE [Candidatus Margulisiibacteriota bacterium]|nr:cell division ATP-binding protein FtsE [Candidatus Margulisiibacteriota bacterium]